MNKILKFLNQACIIAGLVYGLTNCKETPDPDPCEVLKPFEADFKIQAYFPYPDTTIETDQFILGNGVYFIVSEEYDEYLWILEDDDRTWKTKSFALTFVNEAYGDFDITLIAKRKTSCTSEAIQTDTIKKTFTVHYYAEPSWVPLSQTVPLPFYGKFEGAFEDTPNDIFIVELVNSLNSAGGLATYLYNFPKGCGQNAPYPPRIYYNEIVPSVGFKTYTAFTIGTQFDYNGCIFMHKVFGTLDKNNPDKLNLSYKLPNGKRRIFIGNRKN